MLLSLLPLDVFYKAAFIKIIAIKRYIHKINYNDKTRGELPNETDNVVASGDFVVRAGFS